MLQAQGSSRRPGLVLGVAVFLSFAAPAHARTKVWIDATAGVYHCPGSSHYGTGQRGKVASEGAAIEQGYRAAQGQACSPQVAVLTTAASRAPGVQRQRR